MNYRCKYKTPDGFDNLFMESDGICLTGLWFEGSPGEKKHLQNNSDIQYSEKKYLPVFQKTFEWLDNYFEGNQSAELPPLKINNMTVFRKKVLGIVKQIPFGKTLSYGQIANKIAEGGNIKLMSAQAVGGAVAWNPVCIIIPCHRVLGTDGSLTGYSGGIENKKMLLAFEGYKK